MWVQTLLNKELAERLQPLITLIWKGGYSMSNTRVEISIDSFSVDGSVKFRIFTPDCMDSRGSFDWIFTYLDRHGVSQSDVKGSYWVRTFDQNVTIVNESLHMGDENQLQSVRLIPSSIHCFCYGNISISGEIPDSEMPNFSSQAEINSDKFIQQPEGDRDTPIILSGRGGFDFIDGNSNAYIYLINRTPEKRMATIEWNSSRGGIETCKYRLMGNSHRLIRIRASSPGSQGRIVADDPWDWSYGPDRTYDLRLRYKDSINGYRTFIAYNQSHEFTCYEFEILESRPEWESGRAKSIVTDVIQPGRSTAIHAVKIEDIISAKFTRVRADPFR